MLSEDEFILIYQIRIETDTGVRVSEKSLSHAYQSYRDHKLMEAQVIAKMCGYDLVKRKPAEPAKKVIKHKHWCNTYLSVGAGCNCYAS